MRQFTKEEAIKLFKTKFWEEMEYEQIARFQLYQNRLCIPFDVFHEAIEKTLGRPVFTHEFGSNGSIKAELEGRKPAPTFEDIVNLIPKDKRIIITI